MARRKSVCVRWTLVLMLVLLNSFVFSRPQDSSPSFTTESSIAESETSAENVIRYNETYNISYQPLSVISNNFLDKNVTVKFINLKLRSDDSVTDISSTSIDTKKRQNRLINDRNYNKNLQTLISKNNKLVPVNNFENKPIIKKVVTKWTDKAKYEDLQFSNELKTSYDSNMNQNSDEYGSSTENDIRPTIKYQYNVPNNKVNNRYRPKPNYSAETQVYSSNVQIYDNNYPHSFTRPSYMFSTPNPTPIITNVGYPKPWPENNLHVNIKSTTRKPIKPTRPKRPTHHNYHNHRPQAAPNYEISTIKSQPSYTDRIVIRPEEYNASPYDCPTIFLSLNNTFQGEGKEVCPDLNIAVNTNVINKNNLVETEEEEEDSDTSLTDIFGLPFGESESEEPANTNESSDSNENQDQTEDASIEGQSLANYNALNEISDEVSIDSSSLGQYTLISRPKRPHKKKKDPFGLSSIVNFFQPVLKGFTWLAAINPLSFSAVSFVLTPLILLVAGFSAFATFFSPWAFPYARDASVDPNGSPQWQWDDNYKTWYWNTFANTRKLNQGEDLRPTVGKELKSPMCLGWLNNVNDWLRRIIEKIKNFSDANVIRKGKRRKRETWSIRVT